MTRFFKNRQTFFAFFASHNRFTGKPLQFAFSAEPSIMTQFFQLRQPREAFSFPPFTSPDSPPGGRFVAVVFSGAFDYDTGFRTRSGPKGLFSSCLPTRFGLDPALLRCC